MPTLAPMKTSRPATRNGSLIDGDDPLADHGRGLDRRVVQQRRELVAAEPGGGVAGPYATAQPPRDQREQLVPGVVAEAVVDRLEPVQVDEEHAGRVGRRCRGRRAPG